MPISSAAAKAYLQGNPSSILTTSATAPLSKAAYDRQMAAHKSNPSWFIKPQPVAPKAILAKFDRFDDGAPVAEVSRLKVGRSMLYVLERPAQVWPQDASLAADIVLLDAKGKKLAEGVWKDPRGPANPTIDWK